MRKKIIKLTCLLLMSGVLLYGCTLGNVAYIDDSITNIDGVSIGIVSTNEKKAFVNNVDSELMIERFGELGELATIVVSLEGSISTASLPTSATAMVTENGSSHVKGTNETASYYTDFFLLKIKMPNTAVRVNNLDGNGPQYIDTANVTDGYYTHKIEWLFGDISASNWSIVGDSSTNDNYLYFGFIDAGNETISQYFIHIQYNITFV